MVLGPLVVVFALVGIDYGVWTWAIAGNHEIVALVAGLAMAPLVIALAWLLALLLGSGAIAVARRLGRQIARGLVDVHPARSIRLVASPRARRRGGRSADADAPRKRLAA